MLALRNWRALDGVERAELGLRPQEVYNARKCVDLCSFIELKVQEWVKTSVAHFPVWD